jgi:ribosomal-protein-alanine N-acetyltransferase
MTLSHNFQYDCHIYSFDNIGYHSIMLRELIETDLPQMLAMEEATEAAPWTLEVFERCFTVGYYGWAIEQDNKILGFVIVSFSAGECHVLNLCVHPDHQRQGFGRELLHYALKASKRMGAGIAYLEVRHSNLPAIGLYHHPAGREDALVFAKDLTVE